MVATKDSKAAQLSDSGIDLEVVDVTGQRRARLRNYARDARVRDLIRDLVDRLGLNRSNGTGAPVVYRGRLERESRHLHDSEIVGEAIQPQDVIRLLPDIEAAAEA